MSDLKRSITARYDDLGRKAWFDDPNMGKWGANKKSSTTATA